MSQDSIKRAVKAKICWIAEKDGGRKNPPPLGTRYSPVVKFKESDNSGEHWSADFVCGEVDDNLCFMVDFSFLADSAPYHYLYSGNEFELFEGARLVARGIVL